MSEHTQKPENHIAAYGQYAQVILSPLNKYGVNYFCWDRVFDDGTFVVICSNEKWIEYFFNHRLYADIKTFEFSQKPSEHKEEISLWHGLDRSAKVFNAAVNYFQIDNGITFTEPGDGCCDFFHFGSNPGNNGIINFYINHLDLLNSVINDFKENYAELIRDIQKERLVWSSKIGVELSEKPYSTLSEGLYLTKREKQIAMQLLQGKSAEGIAETLYLSKRTVETHVNNMKVRFSCNKLFQLAFALGKNKLVGMD